MIEKEEVFGIYVRQNKCEKIVSKHYIDEKLYYTSENGNIYRPATNIFIYNNFYSNNTRVCVSAKYIQECMWSIVSVGGTPDWSHWCKIPLAELMLHLLPNGLKVNFIKDNDRK